jgi:hypothetical protein
MGEMEERKMKIIQQSRCNARMHTCRWTKESNHWKRPSSTKYEGPRQLDILKFSNWGQRKRVGRRRASLRSKTAKRAPSIPRACRKVDRNKGRSFCSVCRLNNSITNNTTNCGIIVNNEHCI